MGCRYDSWHCEIYLLIMRTVRQGLQYFVADLLGYQDKYILKNYGDNAFQILIYDRKCCKPFLWF